MPVPHPPEPVQAPWHAIHADEIWRQLGTTDGGLTLDQARQALARYGRNELPVAAAPAPWRRVAAQFQNLLMVVLLAAVLITAFMGHWLDAGVILAVVLLNASIGALQEGRAEKALQAIRHMLAPRARVLRGGRQQEI